MASHEVVDGEDGLQIWSDANILNKLSLTGGPVG